VCLKPSILVYGYGNPGRQDDGLGIRLAGMIEKWSVQSGYSHIVTDTNYQLNIEDAELISIYDIVIFADASIDPEGDIELTTVTPDPKTEFTMHAVSPGFVVDLCHAIYNRHPDAYLLHMKGFQWGFMETMTKEALENLDKGFNFMKAFLEQKSGKPDKGRPVKSVVL